MLSQRLPLALDSGAFTLPDTGRIAVFGPPAGTDLSPLPKDRVHVIQRLRPEHDAFAAAGYDVASEPSDEYAAAILSLPRARDAAQAMVAEALSRLRPGAPVVVDGQKTDGIDSLLKAVKQRVEVSPAIAKAHGKIFALSAPEVSLFDDWTARPRQVAERFRTLPGVFSADSVDPASRLLAEVLPARLPKRIGDLGAGWGWLAAAALAREGVEEVHLIEADRVALSCAQQNITDDRARFHWADALRFKPEKAFDAIIMNPPFHSGRKADPALGEAFINAAAGILSPQGVLWLVANRHLPYEATLKTRFRELEEIAGSPGFKIYRAAKPAPVSVRAKSGRN